MKDARRTIISLGHEINRFLQLNDENVFGKPANESHVVVFYGVIFPYSYKKSSVVINESGRWNCSVIDI